MNFAKKLRVFLVFLFVFFIYHWTAENKSVYGNYTYGDYDYSIINFHADIDLQKNSKLKVTETLHVFFPSPRHGIFRVIPVIYNTGGKTINARIKLLSIKDGVGKNYEYETSRLAQSLKLKIGDPDVTVMGPKTYVISYEIDDVVMRYDSHDEVYWNITGSEWDTDIKDASATFTSPFAAIEKSECFAGVFGGSEHFCTTQTTSGSALFDSTTTLGTGRDMTMIIALNKNNGLEFPGTISTISKTIYDNWGYLLSFVPTGFFFWLWYKRGRDNRYISDNIYFVPKDKTETVNPLFKREFLPMVYSPINGLTPSQVGTVLDERVDIDDIVAEILELGRLGYIKIDKIETPKLIGKGTDYVFTRLDKDELKLNDFQIYLLDELFKVKSSKFSSKALAKLNPKYITFDSRHYVALADENKCILLSSLKNTFYSALHGYRERLYESLKDKYFEGRPDKVKDNSVGGFIAANALSFIAIIVFGSQTANFFPIAGLVTMFIPGFLFAWNMPKRTAWGYSLFRQIKGLQFYLEKGKWRIEVAEKRMFFDEMLPLAVSLGIVNKLADDMKALSIEPPTYMSGVNINTFTSDIRGFRTTAASTLVSAPQSSGHSSWSGGSGFSGGGSSGGGFGGGGGGSW